MLENYYKYKLRYKDFIILLRVGNFYEVLDEDSLIINRLMNYKLTKVADTLKCGFPSNSLEKVIMILDDNQINYCVIDKDVVIESQEYEENQYNSFEIDIKVIKYNILKVNKITKVLNELVYTEDFYKILDKIEDILK